MPRLTELFVFILEGENEGITGYFDKESGTWKPLIAKDEIELKQLRELAECITRESHQSYKIVRFIRSQTITE